MSETDAFKRANESNIEENKETQEVVERPKNTCVALMACNFAAMCATSALAIYKQI